MISFKWNESNLKDFYSMTDRLISNIKKEAYNGLKEACEQTRDYALDKKRGSKDKKLILYKLDKDKTKLTGRIYTTFDHAPFLEFGTGTKFDGTLPHIGKTMTFKNSGYRIWLLPKEVADNKGLKLPIERLRLINGREFYLMFPTQPYPFMRPTAFYRRKPNKQLLKESIKKGIREAVK